MGKETSNDDAPPAESTSLSWLSKFVDDGHLAALSGNEAKLMVAMLRYANYRTLEAFPSVAKLMEKTGIDDRRGIRRAARGAAAKGVLLNGSTDGVSSPVRRLMLPETPGVKNAPGVKITRHRG